MVGFGRSSSQDDVWLGDTPRPRGGRRFYLGPEMERRVAEEAEQERSALRAGSGKKGGFQRPYRDNTGDADRRRSARIRGRVTQAEREAPVETPVAKTLQDYIMELESMGMGGGADFGALRSQLQAKTADSDARLEAMYRSLGKSRDAAVPELNQAYDTAKSNMEQASQQAAASIAQGYQDAQAQRADQLAKLGIQDAAAGAEGQRLAEDQGFANQIAQQGSQGSINANEAGRANSLAYNTDMRGVGDMQGVEARSALQMRLNDELAGLAFEESAQRAQNRNSVISQAMQMMQAEQGGGLTEWQRAQLERDYALAMMKNQPEAQDPAAVQTTRRRFWTDLLEQYDGDVQKANQVYQEAAAAGMI